jgi:hypothetical protein
MTFCQKEIENVSLLKRFAENRLELKQIAFNASLRHQSGRLNCCQNG